ncbi:HET-domain-containing protein [Macroventuria anomochaeta]|uniref:HET-domain-containing protein n=1 Tax=Macroventuria anomochaeta TaxID=301207 RepID=A0ACB6RJ82_9PLEO|nr:HET-domain-containing protein [Macroventuria anomochaeta]KAF2621873.1 HET-domain-containing protein [Macroventuria anomochaeta]
MLASAGCIARDVPPYAILSHTWGEQAELKGGYQKIFFCAHQAKRDGLDHFWVDTCCIVKANNTELSEAISSMFRWYQNAARCYAYLSDAENNNILDGEGASAFKRSRWFTRGWMLQELLAPRSVEIFSKEGARQGDEESLGHIIHKLTGIPLDALSGKQMSEHSVAERFSWAGDHETTLREDGAYCLLGIFDIHLPLIYGEGK